MKPAAGYRPLAYSSPEAVQTTGTVVVDFDKFAPVAVRARHLLAVNHFTARAAQLRKLGVERPIETTRASRVSESLKLCKDQSPSMAIVAL
jgi:hypothetical protein